MSWMLLFPGNAALGHPSIVAWLCLLNQLWFFSSDSWFTTNNRSSDKFIQNKMPASSLLCTYTMYISMNFYSNIKQLFHSCCLLNIVIMTFYSLLNWRQIYYFFASKFQLLLSLSTRHEKMDVIFHFLNKCYIIHNDCSLD